MLSIFRPDYAAGGAILTVLAASHAVRAATGPSVQILSVSGHSRLLGTPSVVCSLVLVAGMWLFTAAAGPPGAAWAVTFAINVWLVFRGISKGIEKFVSWAMPAMAVCALIVLVRVINERRFAAVGRLRMGRRGHGGESIDRFCVRGARFDRAERTGPVSVARAQSRAGSRWLKNY